MHCHPFHPTVEFVAVVTVLTAWAVPCAAQTEIDVFMERVLDRREENWITLRQYVLDEREVFEVRGPDRVPLQSMHREYMWYVRDGYLIRSPVRLNGATVGDRERREYEENWLRQERRRSVGQQRQPQAFSRRSAYDNVTTAIERLWGTSVGRELSREITEDARLWRDGLAAIVSATDRILAHLGGVGEVGFGQAVERTRDGYVMLETERLDHVEIARLMTALIPELAAAVATATPDELDGFQELVELAVTFELPLPEVAGALEQAHATVASRGLSDRARDLDEARTSLARMTERGADADPTRDPGAPTSAVAVSPLGSVTVSLQPRFVSEAFFLDFEFEPGNYYFAGREEYAGREVVRIEYYPEQLFGNEDGDSDRDRDSTTETGFNKTSLVTLWIDPEEYQIVKFTFDNVGFEFMPLRWLVRLDDLQASMVMGQPIEGVWLPERVELTGALTTAAGSFEVTYARSFTEYRQAEVRSRIRSYDPIRE